MWVDNDGDNTRKVFIRLTWENDNHVFPKFWERLPGNVAMFTIYEAIEATLQHVLCKISRAHGHIKLKTNKQKKTPRNLSKGIPKINVVRISFKSHTTYLENNHLYSEVFTIKVKPWTVMLAVAT